MLKTKFCEVDPRKSKIILWCWTKNKKDNDSASGIPVWPTRCCEVSAANSTSSLPQKTSALNHPIFWISYQQGGYHLCGLSAKMTNQFFWTKKGLKMDLWGKQMGKNVVYWPKTPDFCPLKWQNSKLHSIGPMSVLCNCYWRKTTFFQVRLQLLLPCGPLWVWGTSASTYGWGRQRRCELWIYLVIKDPNNSSPSFPSWRAWEDPAPQSVRAGLVPQDGGDQVSNIITTFILMIVVNKDEEDDARSWAVCLRLWHPHRGLPALYPVSTLRRRRRTTKSKWAFIAWVSETLDSRHPSLKYTTLVQTLHFQESSHNSAWSRNKKTPRANRQ